MNLKKEPRRRGEKRVLSKKVEKSKEEWRKLLTAQQYEVCINHGTEPPFSGRYNDGIVGGFDGVFVCVCCNEELFASNVKFDSGSGWPSFWKPISEERIEYIVDTAHGMLRTEVNCGMCGAHLGHVFDDGPKPTNQRYCINSVSLQHKDKHQTVHHKTD